MDSPSKQDSAGSNSPLRKQLAKKIINYYDQLSHIREQDRSRSPPKNKSRSKSKGKDTLRASQNLRDSKGSLTSSTNQNANPSVLVYEDEEHRKVKMQKLKELMKNELDKAATDGALDPDLDTLSKLHPGYPSFMQETYSPDKMLEDHHHTNVKVFLGEKLDDFEKKVATDKELVEEVEEDVIGPDDKLYHIVTRKTITAASKADENFFDFHQRKAKEIRRLQYAASLGQPKKVEHYFPVWTLLNGKPVPSEISSETNEFDFDEQRGVLSVNPGQQAKVKAKNETKGGFPRFIGTVQKPKHEDGDCDFIVLTPNGERRKILTYLRPEPPKTRHVPGANSTILDAKNGTPLGRAKSTLVGKDPITGKTIEYAKAILLDSDNSLDIILLKIISSRECIIKRPDRSERVEEIIRDEDTDLGDGIQARKLTLKKHSHDKTPFQREVYLYINSFFLQPLRIFDNENIFSECENLKDYNGKLQWKKVGDEEKLYIPYTEKGGKMEVVEVILDDAYGNDIANRLNYLAMLARKRYEDWLASLKKKRHPLGMKELKFDVLDSKGRKMEVIIRHDPKNDYHEDGEAEGEANHVPENTYYHLVVENDKVLPFKRKTKEEKRAHEEQKRREKEEEENKLKKYEVKIEGVVFVEEPELPITDKLKHNLSEVAKHVGLNFKSDRMNESYVQFMSSLPPKADLKKAALKFKSMIHDSHRSS